MTILSFMTNLQVQAVTGGTAYGSGPTRLVEHTNTWKIVAVTDQEVIATLAEFPKNMTPGDRDIPISVIESAPQ